MTPSLFESSAPIPLAERLRPRSLADVVGQEHLLGPKGPIGRMAAAGRLPSLILFGGPGCGKTTIARLLAQHTQMHFEPISAIQSGVADLKKIFEAAEARRRMGKGTLLFFDECHRFNRSQQDSFLPYIENGTIVFLGATTETPSFALNPALLSRCQVHMLKRLDEAALLALMARAERDAGRMLPVTQEGRSALAAMADGDGRYLLTLCDELLELEAESAMGPDDLAAALQRRAPAYDRSRDVHYGLLSAFQKSIRGSDPDAALYWLARMIEGGEDARVITRRLIVMASEEISMADPQALVVAEAAAAAVDRVGLPEAGLILAQATVHLATAPKSNAVYAAYKKALDLARRTGSPPPPAHILNAPTELHKRLGMKQGYVYDHNEPDGFSGQNYFPQEILDAAGGRPALYVPIERGYEREIARRVEWWNRLRAEKERARDSGS